MDYTPDEQDPKTEDVETAKKQQKEQFESSKLSKPVRELIKLIFDMKMITNQMIEIGYDAKKMPLGKLSKENIKMGYEVLNELLVEVEKKTKKNSDRI